MLLVVAVVIGGCAAWLLARPAPPLAEAEAEALELAPRLRQGGDSRVPRLG